MSSLLVFDAWLCHAIQQGASVSLPLSVRFMVHTIYSTFSQLLLSFTAFFIFPTETSPVIKFLAKWEIVLDSSSLFALLMESTNPQHFLAIDLVSQIWLFFRMASYSAQNDLCRELPRSLSSLVV